MSVFTIGDATITRVEETNLPTYPARDIFPEFTDAHVAEHKSWLAPHHYEAGTGLIRLAVHSWLLQVGGKKILIDRAAATIKPSLGGPSGTCSICLTWSGLPPLGRGRRRSTW